MSLNNMETSRQCRVVFLIARVRFPGRFRGPSGRAPFSDEGGFTFSEARGKTAGSHPHPSFFHLFFGLRFDFLSCTQLLQPFCSNVLSF